MKKLVVFLSIILNFMVFFVSSPIPAYAIDCSVISSTPNPPTFNDKRMSILLKTNGLAPGKKYWATFDGSVMHDWNTRETGKPAVFTTDTAGQISLNNIDDRGNINHPYPTDTGYEGDNFHNKDYPITIQDPSSGGKTWCNTFIAVKAAASSGSNPSSCSIILSKDHYETSDPIQIRVDNLNTGPDYQHHVYLYRDKEKGDLVSEKCYTTEDLSNGNINLGNQEAGSYYIDVEDSCHAVHGAGENDACHNTTTVGSPNFTDTPLPTPPAPPCLEGKITANGCEQTGSAIGDLPNDPQGLIGKLFTFVLGLSGGIAVLVMIAAGYRYMTSQGNPEAVKGAQEMIVSAIAGLLFIIFAFVILQIMGIDILHIPGFS